MLNIKEVQSYYTNSPFVNPRHLLREYLQYKILEYLVDSKMGSRISFLGGTSIRIVYSSTRFSEDLDFDNFTLSYEEFEEASEFIKTSLEFEGVSVDIKNKRKGAYHCDIRFPKTLFENDLTPIQSEKILIQIDTMSHGFNYKPEQYLLNKFGVLRNILITPKDILLSQKIYALYNRKRLKGRDFYDISFLLGITMPNYQYLDYMLNITTQKQLKAYLLDNLTKVDLKVISKDVAPFLVSSADVNRVILFKEVIEQVL